VKAAIKEDDFAQPPLSLREMRIACGQGVPGVFNTWQNLNRIFFCIDMESERWIRRMCGRK